MTQGSVYLASPMHTGMVNIHYMTSLFQTVQHLIANKIHYQWDVLLGSGIDVARSWQATNFLKSNMTHLLFIDDDMAWSGDLPVRLLRENQDIIGVPYRKKNTKIIYNIRHDKFVAQHPEKPYLISVDGLATGMLMIKREVFEALIPHVLLVKHNMVDPPIHMFFQKPIIESKEFGGLACQGEDYFFCDLAREKLGCEIIAYVDEDIAHIGPHAYRGAYSDELEKHGGGVFSSEREREKMRVLLK